MEVNIVHEVAALQPLSVGQLRQRFAELFGEATNAGNRTWLIKRITWRMQALAEADLSERTRRRAAELARDADLRLDPPPSKTTTATPPTELPRQSFFGPMGCQCPCMAHEPAGTSVMGRASVPSLLATYNCMMPLRSDPNRIHFPSGGTPGW